MKRRKDLFIWFSKNPIEDQQNGFVFANMLLQTPSALSAVALSLKMEYFKYCQITSLPLEKSDLKIYYLLVKIFLTYKLNPAEGNIDFLQHHGCGLFPQN